MTAALNATDPHVVRITRTAADLIPGDVIEAPIIGSMTVLDTLHSDGPNGGLVTLVLDMSDNPYHVTVNAAELVTVLDTVPADQPEPAWVATIIIDPEWLA